MAHLSRFIEAQQGVYEQALDELRKGKKRSHWMWFVFPQLAGIGRSALAERYAISNIDEARSYLADPLLRSRLDECVHAMLLWEERRSAVSILGEIDAMKFRSSMTLFEVAAKEGGSALFSHALEAFHEGQRDNLTLSLLL
jgi:Uncharacterized conserved protein